MGILAESGATTPTQIRCGSSAMSKGVLTHTTVRKAILWVSVMQESRIPLPMEGCVRFGQLYMGILMWESTTTAGIQLGILQEFGASPLITSLNSSLFHIVIQHTIVKKVIHWVSAIRES